MQARPAGKALAHALGIVGADDAFFLQRLQQPAPVQTAFGGCLQLLLRAFRTVAHGHGMCHGEGGKGRTMRNHLRAGKP